MKVSSRHRRLHVITTKDVPATTTPMATQDCTRCSYFGTCWDGGQPPRVVAVNLLVCRMKYQTGRVREDATAAFIKAIEPGLAKQAESARAKAPHLTRDEIMAELVQTAIEKIIYKWDIAQVGYPLWFLFAPMKGCVRWDAIAMARDSTDPRKAAYPRAPIDGTREWEDRRTHHDSEVWDWDAESSLDTQHGEDPAQATHRWARDHLTTLQWRLYAAMLSATRENDQVPTLAGIARALKTDKRHAQESWLGACKEIREHGPQS